MKIVFGIILILVILFTLTLYFDQQKEQQVYSFCTNYSVGNDIKKIQKEAKKKKQVLVKGDNNTILYELKLFSPFLKSAICEIKLAEGKITEMSFIKE